MMKRVFACTALVMALGVMLCLPTAAQGQQVYQGVAQAGALPVGTEAPCILNQCLMYTGDFDAAGQNPNALWNNNSLPFGIEGAVYVPFNVPRKFKGAKGKTDWQLQGLFVNELMGDVGFGIVVPSVSWAIVQGVANNGNPGGGQVKTICSGTGTPTISPTGRNAFGLTEFTIMLTGAACPAGTLESGLYWMTFVPTTEGLAYLSDVEDNTPANAQGPGTGAVDDSFFVSAAFGFSDFTDAAGTACGGIGCDAFSFGVIGSAVH